MSARSSPGPESVYFASFPLAGRKPPRNTLESVRRLLGVSDNVGRITWQGRLVQVDAFPTGIDAERYAEAGRLVEVQDQIRRVKAQLAPARVVLSVDRTDYSKGIPQRLEAFDLLLEREPQYREKVTMVMVAAGLGADPLPVPIPALCRPGCPVPDRRRGADHAAPRRGAWRAT